MELNLFLKSLHVVGFVSWFAGLFYLVRIFVYHVEADEQEEPARKILTDQYMIMEGRVYRVICNPAMMITWAAGLGMIVADLAGVTSFGYFAMGTTGWLIAKLFLLVLLLVYHLRCKRVMLSMADGERPYSAWQLRLFNEVPTLFLVAIPFITVFGKSGRLNYWYLAIGIGLFCFMIYRGAKAYRKRREAS